MIFSFKKFLESFSEEEMMIANKTSRGSGSISPNAIVPRFVSKSIDISKTILDFGSGKDALHAEKLRGLGFKNIIAYDFGSNVKDGIHDPNALSKKYDCVYASNVLNTQSSEKMLSTTLDQITKSIKDDGVFICNLPLSPRKFGDLNSDLLLEHLSNRFESIKFYRIDKDDNIVETKGCKNPSTIFMCSQLK